MVQGHDANASSEQFPEYSMQDLEHLRQQIHVDNGDSLKHRMCDVQVLQIAFLEFHHVLKAFSLCPRPGCADKTGVDIDADAACARAPSGERHPAVAAAEIEQPNRPDIAAKGIIDEFSGIVPLVTWGCFQLGRERAMQRRLQTIKSHENKIQ